MKYIVRYSLVAGVCAAALAAAAQPAGAQRWSGDRRSMDTTFAFSASGAVVIDAPSAAITVTGWARNEARVVVATGAGSVDVGISRERIELDVNNRSNAVRLQVWVPIGVSVAVDTRAGGVTISGTRGSVDVETLAARVEVSDTDGRTNVESASGNVLVQRARGTTGIAVIGGSVTVTEVEGTLAIETTNADARVERANGVRLQFETVSGSLEFSGTMSQQATSLIETHSGSVTLRFPADVRATLELDTTHGEMSSDFPVTLRGGGDRAAQRDNRVRVPINGGGATIRIETFNGRVNIRRLSTSSSR